MLTARLLQEFSRLVLLLAFSATSALLWLLLARSAAGMAAQLVGWARP